MFLADNRVPARRNEVYMKKTSLTLTSHIPQFTHEYILQ